MPVLRHGGCVGEDVANETGVDFGGRVEPKARLDELVGHVVGPCGGYPYHRCATPLLQKVLGKEGGLGQRVGRPHQDEAVELETLMTRQTGMHTSA